jgi:hypothetical protein
MRPSSPASDTGRGSHDDDDGRAAVPLSGGHVIAEPARRLFRVGRKLDLEDDHELRISVRAAEDDHGVGVVVGDGDRKRRLHDISHKASRDANACAAEQRRRE